ncbi:MAG: radical SAM protein [Candidatus Gygaella obscura]|nr:radical SAM protein [Candidatus Gygaella obscura]
MNLVKYAEIIVNNQKINESEFRKGRITLKSYPPNVFMQLDGPCNHNCIFCSRPEKYDYFNLEEFKKRFVDIMPVFLNAKMIYLTGAGEFLMLPDSLDIIKFFDNNFPASGKSFATNATCFNNYIFNYLESIKSNFSIQVSLHASNAELHKKLVGRYDFDQTIQNLSRLLAISENNRNLDVYAMFVLNTLNISDLPEFVKLCSSMGIRKVCCNYNSVYRLDQKKLSLFFNQAKANDVLNSVRSLASDLSIEINLPPLFAKDNSYYKFCKDYCSDPWYQIMLNFKGEVMPCCLFEGVAPGNILEQGFKKIWNGEVYKALRESILNKKKAIYCNYCIENNPESVNHIKSHLIIRGKNKQELQEFLKPEFDTRVTIDENKMIQFVWRLNYECNFNCPYCSVMYWGEEKITRKDKTVFLSVDEWIEHWEKIYDIYGSVEIHIVGGEPTIYPGFFKLVERLSKKHYFGFDTNLSADFTDFIKTIPPERVSFGIGASFHPTQTKFEDFINKVDRLARANFKIWINYVAYPEQLNEIAYYKNEVEKRGYHFVMQPFCGKYKDKIYPKEYIDNEKNIMRGLAKGNSVLEENMQYQLEQKIVKGKLCYAGMKFAFIHADGTIKRCGEGPSPAIGNFFDKEFRLFDKPLPCDCDTCYCEFKWLVENERKTTQQEENKSLIVKQVKNSDFGDKFKKINRLIMDDELDESKKIAREVLDCDKDNGNGFSVMAKIYRMKAQSIDLVSAREDYAYLAKSNIKRALEYDPDDLSAQLEAIRIFIIDKDVIAAKKIFDNIMIKYPESEEAHALVKRIEHLNRELHRSHQAVEIFRKEKNIFSRIKSKVIAKDMRFSYRVIFDWDMHYDCNYSCSYCYYKNKWNELSLKNIYPGNSKLIRIWSNIYDTFGKCFIRLNGREPSVYPDFFNLIKGLSLKHTLELNTNLFFDFERLIETVAPENVSIKAIFHKENVSLESFLNKASYLNRHGFQVSVVCLAHPDNLNELYRIKQAVEDINLTFLIEPFQGVYKELEYPHGYSFEQMRIISDIVAFSPVNKLIFEPILRKEKIINNDRRLCRMGQLYVKVFSDGEIYRCRDNLSEKIGNLYNDDNLFVWNEPRYCDKKSCSYWNAMIVGKEKKWIRYWR